MQVLRGLREGIDAFIDEGRDREQAGLARRTHAPLSPVHHVSQFAKRDEVCVRVARVMVAVFIPRPIIPYSQAVPQNVKLLAREIHFAHTMTLSGIGNFSANGLHKCSTPS